jgi:exodeoxyribonuclease VII large subunit
MNEPANSKRIYTVSGLNREVGQLLAHGLPLLWVEGEISNFTAPASGHWYFTLKDRDAQLRCAMFRGRQNGMRFKPANGQHVAVRGRVGLYEPRGEYQMTVELMEEAGQGALQRAFEQLKQRLSAEGLFDIARKRALPTLPRRIAVITSGTGAALRDILHVLQQRFPLAQVLLLPVPVQGTAAAPAICAALDSLSTRTDCQVVILARGGGSIEDLWAFNEETVARAIHRCALPVVSGIGHETDFTIADFVADVRAPTPSAAAQLVSPDQQSLLQQLGAQLARLRLGMQRQLSHATQHHAAAARRLQQTHPGTRLHQQAQRLDELEQRMRLALGHSVRESQQQLAAVTARLQRVNAGQVVAQLTQRCTQLAQHLRRGMIDTLNHCNQRLALAQRALDAVSPLAVLGRGYALVVTPEGQLIRQAASLHVGDALDIRLADGRVQAIVHSIKDA